MIKRKMAIIGAGNLGSALASGLLHSEIVSPENLILTRRNLERLSSFKEAGVEVTNDNIEAVKKSDLVFVAVKPYKFEKVINEILPVLEENKSLISMVTGIGLDKINQLANNHSSTFRVMPNTALSIRESMTLISTTNKKDKNLSFLLDLFNKLGRAVVGTFRSKLNF